MAIRLGFHYHVPARLEGSKILMPGYQGVFIDSLADHCEQITCFLHSPGRGDAFHGDYAIRSTNVELVDIGPHTSVPHRAIFAGRFAAPLEKWLAQLDVLLLRGPSPLLPAFAKAAGELPLALLLVGDYLAGVDDLPQPRWRKDMIRLWSRWNQARQLSVARRSLTFVNSRLLYKQLQPYVPCLLETRTTTLSQADFYFREDTCQKPPYRLLYTGRMDRAKGLLEMVQALALLVAQGYDCVLDLVGMVNPGDPVIADIAEEAEALHIAERVCYHGYRPLGPPLFDFYRRADIYVIASQSSEGFPRTIWEAMAHSLPVIATRVGSIPDFIEKSAFLIEPRDVVAIAHGVIHLINKPEIRQKNIQAGRLLARQNTLECRSKEMIQQIENYCLAKDE